MSNQESQSEIAVKIPAIFHVIYSAVFALVMIATVVLFAALPPLVIALIVL